MQLSHSLTTMVQSIFPLPVPWWYISEPAVEIYGDQQLTVVLTMVHYNSEKTLRTAVVCHSRSPLLAQRKESSVGFHHDGNIKM